ncbi:hypothetical protein [Polaromonas sp.]|uniref:hypothetical protein n=1 Tax=Polaromonas sp. TaxID=1869339 RepID=UPI00352B31B4
MKQSNEPVREWKRLYAQWHEADRIAKRARDEVRKQLLDMSEGGRGPTNDQIWDADDLEKQAELLRLEMDGFVFGFMS